MRILSFSVLALTVAILAGCNQQPTVSPQANTPPIDLSADIAQAKAGNKLLLMEFGSSDSCPPCMTLEVQVFSKPEFQEYAKSNLVFVRLDFPDRSKLSADVTATNKILGEQFKIDGFPTFVALDHDGKETWRTEGVTKSQKELKGFIDLIESVRSQQK
jgi:thioredoxin-related protein